MTSKHDDFEHNESALGSHKDESLVSDRFELLSAYIDGELSSSERNQVQQLIDRDPEVKKLYTQLLTLQGQMQSSAAPPSRKSVEEITAGVFQSIKQRRRQRRAIWGGSAIAATILAGITGLIPGFSPGFKIAEIGNSNNKKSEPIMLAVAVNKPAIDIPKVVNGYGIELKDSEQK